MTWIFIVLAQWNNNPQADMWLYTLSQLWDIQSLLLLFKAPYLVVKQQLLNYPFYHFGLTQPFTTHKANTLPLYHKDSCGSVILLFGFLICRFWAYLMNVIPEMSCTMFFKHYSDSFYQNGETLIILI